MAHQKTLASLLMPIASATHIQQIQTYNKLDDGSLYKPSNFFYQWDDETASHSPYLPVNILQPPDSG